MDRDGNLFISDRDNNRIRRVDAVTGIITTVAGNGEEGFSGDGGPGTEAALDFPRGIGLDREGNLFIADQNNHRYRRVDKATGIITTVAGTGEFVLSEDGGLATETGLSLPYAVVLDAMDNLLLVGSDSRVRKVDATTGIITTVVGVAESGFSGDGGPAGEAFINQPFGMVMDGIGNLFLSDTLNNRIRKVEVTTDIITTLAGTGERGFVGNGGPAAEAAVRSPLGLLVDSDGNLVLSDAGNHRIRKVDLTSGIISTLVGTGEAILSGDEGPATEAALNSPGGVARDQAGNLFIADRNDNRIRRVDASTGIITTVAGSGIFGPGTGTFSGDGGPATEATLNAPIDVTVDGEGHLFIADVPNYRIRRVDAVTGIITTVAGTGEISFSGDGGPAIEAGMDPRRLTLDGAGNLLISDTDNHRIRRVDTNTGIITTVAGTGEKGFSGDGGPATEAALDTPHAVAVDVDGNLFIAAGFNHRIRKVDASTGIITTIAGNGDFSFTGDGGPALEASFATPTDLTMDGAGNLFISDNNNRRIRAVRGVAQPVVLPGVGPRAPLLNLTTYQPSGWSAPIVVSTTADTNTDSDTISSTDNLFVDFAFINRGPGPNNLRVDVVLLVDGEEVFTDFFDFPLKSNFFVFWEDVQLDPLPPGETHPDPGGGQHFANRGIR